MNETVKNIRIDGVQQMKVSAYSNATCSLELEIFEDDMVALAMRVRKMYDQEFRKHYIAEFMQEITKRMQETTVE